MVGTVFVFRFRIGLEKKGGTIFGTVFVKDRFRNASGQAFRKRSSFQKRSLYIPNTVFYACFYNTFFIMVATCHFHSGFEDLVFLMV